MDGDNLVDDGTCLTRSNQFSLGLKTPRLYPYILDNRYMGVDTYR